MKNLGKIILFISILSTLNADVKVSVDKDQITRGERVTFTLSVAGAGEVRIPPLDELCGYSIEGRMQSRKDVFANGQSTQELSLMYEFMPQKSCVIEPFTVTVNGKEEMTKAINITVSKMSISTNEPFMVTMQTNKASVYVGEPFEMKVDFSERQNMDSVGEAISLPESKNIWIKSEYKGQAFVKDRYTTRQNMYALAAQQSGQLNLGPLRWDVKVRSRSRDSWGMIYDTAKTRTVFSNELAIAVKPLPDGIDLVGNLDILVKVDKKEVNAGEAVNLTIEVKGRANVEDIKAFDIHVSGAQAFKEEPIITHYLQEGKYFGSFTQKLAIVAERDFSVPGFELRYMDVETDTIKTITSEAIEIKVLNPVPLVKEELKISRPNEELKDINVVDNTLNVLQGMLLLLGGFILGLIASMIPWKKFFTKKKAKYIVSAKESKEVLQLLMSNMNSDSEIAVLVEKLCENLYEGKTHVIDKKHLKAIAKKLQV